MGKKCSGWLAGWLAGWLSDCLASQPTPTHYRPKPDGPSHSAFLPLPTSRPSLPPAYVATVALSQISLR